MVCPVRFIDPHLFGSEDSFRSQYARRASEMSREEFQALRARVQPVCHRTLRRQVVEYIRYTNRIPSPRTLLQAPRKNASTTWFLPTSSVRNRVPSRQVNAP